MSRRVALARALAMDPMLVMYDEPFAGLDPISLHVIGNLVRQFNDALGISSIVVTYDVTESLKVVDYVYIIADGVVLAEGVTADIVASEDPYVRQFIHSLPDGPMAFHYPSTRRYLGELRAAPAPKESA
jgi:phospholipid/cholesterol/gamma-HCH transport system ATP-binding protein